MKQLYSEMLIHAAPAAVWEVLTDLKSYADWNPSHVWAEGQLEEGKTFRLLVQLPDAGRTHFRPRTLRLTPQKEWVFRAHLWGIPGLFSEDYTVQLTAEGPGHTRLIFRQNFRGVFVPFVWGWFFEKKIIKGRQMRNHALKNAVEKLQALKTIVSGEFQLPLSSKV